MAATLVWLSGAESGGTSEFTNGASNGGGGLPTIQTTTKRTGAYAVQAPHDAFVAARIPNLAATSFYRFAFFAAANPAATVPIASLGSSSLTPKVFIFLNAAGTLGWGFGFGVTTPTTSGSGTILLGQWNLIEFKFVRDAAVGGVELYLNGVLQFSDFTSTPSTTSGTSASAMTLRFGNDINQPGTNQSGEDMYFDDMAAATGAYIGDGGCVAIQGKAGSPHYDAWTKNGGAASAAEAWSETPMSATKNCSSVVNGDNQTMPTNDTAISSKILAGATINGCMIVGVGKTSATGGGAGAHTLYRQGGVDTLNPNDVFSTTDTWFPNPVNGDSCNVFTDVLADLETSEFGAQASSPSGQTITVEDMWLMIDFLNPPSVTPSTGSLALTGYQPLVSNSSSPNITPGTGTLVLTGQPAAMLQMDPQTGAVAVTGQPALVFVTQALTVEFTIADVVARYPLVVTFDIMNFDQPVVPLTVKFDIEQSQGDPLTVTFDILGDIVNRRLKNDVQGPVARVTLT